MRLKLDDSRFPKNALFIIHSLKSKICPLAILMPLEENLYKVPNLKVLISGQKLLGRPSNSWVGRGVAEL